MWQLVALGAVALVLIAVGIWQLVADWGRERQKRAKVERDLEHATASVVEQKRIAEIQANPIPRGKRLLAMILARTRRAVPK